MAPSTRKAVLTALDLLGYERPERLRPHPSGLIGMIVPELTNPIFPIFAQNLESTMSTAGYTPLLCTQAAGGITEDSYVQMLIDQHAAGIIFVSGLHADTSASTDRYQRLEDLGIPAVTINGNRQEISAPDFSTNDAAAIAQGVRHLASLGHTRIGLAMGPDRFIPSQQKALGFKETMENMFPGEPSPIVNTLYTVEGGQAAAAQLIAMGCTAILCGSDIMALGAIRYCESSYFKVPEDISIMGYDDSPLMVFTNPPLTTFRQPVRSMCEAALSTLSSLIGGATVSPRSLSFESELIVRKSTGPCPN